MATQSFSAVKTSNSRPNGNDTVYFWYDLSDIIKQYNGHYIDDSGLYTYETATINSIQISLTFEAHNNESESFQRFIQIDAKFMNSTSNNTMLMQGDPYGTTEASFTLQPGSQTVNLSFQLSSSYVTSESYHYLCIKAYPGAYTASYVWLRNAPTIAVDYTVPEGSTSQGEDGPSNPTTSYNTRVTIVGPSGGSREYGVPVNFAFDVQTNGTLADWRAQYSTDDGYTWQTLPTQNVTTNSSNGPYEVRFSSSTTFPVGTIRWRVQAIANGETYGDSWTSASFTVTFASLDPDPGTVIVTPTDPGTSTTSYNTRISIITPYGGTQEYGSRVNFGFDVQTNGTLADWRAQYSTDDGYSWKTLTAKNVTTNSSNGPIEVRFYSDISFPVGTVRWRVQAIASGESYGTTWTSASFTVAENTSSDSGDSIDSSVSCTIIQPSNGSKRNGSEAIPFKFSVRSSSGAWAPAIEYQAQYSTDEGITWNALAEDSVDSDQNEISFSVPRMTLPSGPIEWRVRAKIFGDWEYNWTTTSFTVTYEGYGSIQATSGPINTGVLGTAPIRYDATMRIIGETIGQPTLVDARFRWRSGDSSDYIERSMIIANNSAYIIIPVDTFPYGLIQWYMYGKDSSGIESETPVYATYILKSAIDSFPIKPVSTIEQSENAIEFEWGYISINGQKFKKADIQISEDGVTWVTIASFVHDEGTIEVDPLDPASGEDVYEEEETGG